MKRFKDAIIAFLLLFSAFTFQLNAQHVITGKVTGEDNESLVGATVTTPNGKVGTITDVDGMYTISLPKEITKLVFSYVGYQTKSLDVNGSGEYNIDLEKGSFLEEVIIKGVRAGDNTPVTQTTINSSEIENKNLGQDVPYLMRLQPSTVITSDAGTGIGYTGIRIRGSSSDKINVTINGVPLNDPESHGVYWVDIPNIAGSTESMQIQRGVGTSTNGSGAYGASINLETSNISPKPFIKGNTSFGSFNTKQGSIGMGTGLINDHWFLEGKYTQMSSDGYVDRARADLKSYFAQGGYYGEKTILKAVVFGGLEETYQAWYGVDQWTIDNVGRTFNYAGAIYDENWNVTSYYDNFVDHYEQNHYQLHWIQKLSNKLMFSSTAHYTYGRGYYEEYQQGADLNLHDLPAVYAGFDSVLIDTSTNTYDYFYHDTTHYSDLIRRLWLDNHFYGVTWSLNYEIDKNSNLTFGGAANKYANAKHFGEVIWANYFTLTNEMPRQFYLNTGNKTDINTYLKYNHTFLNKLNLFADAQIRTIHYTAEGTNREYANDTLDIDKNYTFFNPKVGLSYEINANQRAYISYAIANREPNRADFIDSPKGTNVKHETLYDLEIGYKIKGLKYIAEIVGYRMDYKNQLVLTGRLNNVGTPIRDNAGNSYRMGVEVLGSVSPIKQLNLSGNISLSKNKTDYTIYNDADTSFFDYNDVDISFSPNLIFSSRISYLPIQNSEVFAEIKYVGKQYIDNTENEDFALDAYYYVNMGATYKYIFDDEKNINFKLLVNNVLSAKYSSKASIFSGDVYYFPQATINFLASIGFEF